MAVEKKVLADGSTTYYARYFKPDGRRAPMHAVRTVGAKATRAEHEKAYAAARKYASDQRAKVRNGEWAAPDAKEAVTRRLSFSTLVAKFLAEYRTASGDMTYYEFMSRAWLDFFGENTPADGVSVGDVERFRLVRSEKVGPATVRKDLATLSKLFRWAKTRGLVKDNPADADLVKRPRCPKARADQPAPDELAKLLDVARPELARVFEWAALTGMDRQELVDLTFADVKDKAGKVFAPRQKTGEWRIVRLNAPLRRILDECREFNKGFAEDQSKGRLFVRRDGTPWTANGLNFAARRAYKKAGLDAHRPFKRLRHYYGTELAAVGANEFEAAKGLGHSTTDMARVYCAVASERMQELADKLGAAHEKAVRFRKADLPTTLPTTENAKASGT